MQWKNVRLIFMREMRDQLRDRRTLFLIAVLPVMLYPLLGMSFFQLSQFLKHKAAKVLVVGVDQLTEREWLPPLLEGDRFAEELFASQQDRDNLQIEYPKDAGPLSEEQRADARERLTSGELQVVLIFGGDFGERLDGARRQLVERRRPPSGEPAGLPQADVMFNVANDASQVAYGRVARVLDNWRAAVMRKNLADADVPLDAARPFEIATEDVAQKQQRRAAVWSKILPFMVFIWALTGAFYPAVDLCAGEKERGTLETLLTSPARRREIVWGKLLTVMTFSIATAALNLGSLGLTGRFVLDHLKGVSGLGDAAALQMPPLISVVWLGVALVPMAALFSALCLALAAMARSTKEGQYYLMPLLLATMPLMMLPLSPGVELGLGNALIPVTGVVLLLRSFIEGQYAAAMPFVIPVVGVTMACCLLAIRWAEDQFNRESVLFRESERLDLGRWLVHLVRDREETPTLAQAVLCVALVLFIQFFVRVALASRPAEAIDLTFLVESVFISQTVCILTPAIFLSLLFTRCRKRTLLVDHLPNPRTVLAAGALAVFLRPLGFELIGLIQRVYPASGEVAGQLEKQLGALMGQLHWSTMLLLIAVLPAICEEVAFRGFILSGFRRIGHKWWAIGLSAAAFGLAHTVLQQQLAAAAVGLVIGYVAVQTGSLWPCMMMHAVYNGLVVLHGTSGTGDGQSAGILDWMLMEDGPTVCRPWVLLVSGVASVAILYWFHRLPYLRTAEEQIQEARNLELHSVPAKVVSDAPGDA